MYFYLKRSVAMTYRSYNFTKMCNKIMLTCILFTPFTL